MEGNVSVIEQLVGELSGESTVSGHLTGESSISGELSVPPSNNIPYELPPATTQTLGGVIVGDDLTVTEEGRLSVDKATNVEEDNTRPITAAAVYTEVGNINALLATI